MACRGSGVRVSLAPLRSHSLSQGGESDFFDKPVLASLQLDSTFASCQVLQEMFGSLSPDLVALQMSRGPLQGRLRVDQLGGIRFNLLETNQSLFLSGTRRPNPCTVAIPIAEVQVSSPSTAAIAARMRENSIVSWEASFLSLPLLLG